MPKKKPGNNNRKRAGRILFGTSSDQAERVYTSFTHLSKVINHIKGLGIRIVLMSGTFDMLHIGHARYFEEGKKYGDFLIVGVDSDKKVRARKGPMRPIVPEEERVEMLTHIRSVDIVFLKPLEKTKWHLIKTVRPDVLIATQGTYQKKQHKELKKYCGKVMILRPRATTSTSAKIRRLQLGFATRFGQVLEPKLIKAIEDSLKEVKKE